MSARRIGFLFIEGHALMSTAAALEPLRAANLFSDTPCYDVRLLSVSGSEVRSSAGSILPAQPMQEAGMDFDLVFVVAGGDPIAFSSPEVFAWLRRLHHAGIALGGISGGAALLARAALLENRRFTIHWHHYDEMRRQFPKLLLERRLYLIDRDRYTCAGGAAPLDMMHAIIARDHGTAFAQRISDWFIQTEIRVSEAPQQSSIASRYGNLPRPVRAALELMESHVADPLTLEQIAKLAGLSGRQLQRRFQSTLGASVMEVYRGIRLNTARDLLRGSALDVGEIAMMTGFSGQAHFADSYRRLFGTRPSLDRRKPGV